MAVSNSRSYLYVNALSELGMRMDMIAMGALILAATHGSPLWLSGLLLSGVVGGLLASLFSGVIADRYERRKIMIASDLIRACLILVLILLPEPWLILLVRFLLGFAGSFFEVAYRSELPEIYCKDRALEINALVSRLGAVAMVAGFLGGGFLYEQFGYQAVFGFDALSFLLSAGFLMQFAWEKAPRVTGGTSKAMSLRRDMREVLGYMKGKPVLYTVFIILLIDTFGSASHNLGIPLLAEGVDEEKQAFFYGLFWAVWGLGNVISTILMPKLPLLRKSMVHTYLIATIGMSLGFISFLSATSVPWILIFAFLTGLFDAVSVTTCTTIMQQSDNHIRGRIFGITGFLNRTGFGLGFLVAPQVLEMVSLPVMVGIFHGGIITCIVVALVYLMGRKGKETSSGVAM